MIVDDVARQTLTSVHKRIDFLSGIYYFHSRPLPCFTLMRRFDTVGWWERGGAPNLENGQIMKMSLESRRARGT